MNPLTNKNKGTGETTARNLTFSFGGGSFGRNFSGARDLNATAHQNITKNKSGLRAVGMATVDR